jgi:hypothetical protein
MPGPTGSDREALFKFFETTHRFVGKHIESGRDPLGKQVIEENMMSMLMDAWKEFQEQSPLDEAKGRIFEASDDRLLKAGLYGNQLKLKLQTVSNHDERYRRNGGPKLLMKLIGCIDHVLDSLISAIGVGEGLKELKDILGDNAKDE